MPAPNIAFVTPPGTPGWQRWLVLSPAARIVFFAAMLIGFWFLVETVVAMSGWAMKSASPVQHALASLTRQLLPALAAYLILVKLIERRRVGELAPRDIPAFGTAGLVAGAVLFSLVVAVLWLAGSYHVTGTNPQVDWLPAVLVTGIEAGILLALLYAVTHSLWTCIGLHAAWNIMQGTVYGIPVSGSKTDGWLVSRRTGPDWLSGGAFGAEASVVALALCLTLSVILLVIARRRRALVPPGWRRRPR